VILLGADEDIGKDVIAGDDTGDGLRGSASARRGGAGIPDVLRVLTFAIVKEA
jgi:hypothetical protein